MSKCTISLITYHYRYDNNNNKKQKQLHNGICSESRIGQKNTNTNTTMGNSTSQPSESAQPIKKQQKLGIKTGKPICCCCPDTKQPRDKCVVNFGEDHPDCIKLIEAHKICLREEGFDVK